MTEYPSIFDTIIQMRNFTPLTNFIRSRRGKYHDPERTCIFSEKRYTGSFPCAESEGNANPCKIQAFLTVAYALSPIDLVPDFIPVLGYLDDFLILPALVALTVKLIPKDIFERYRKEAEGMWEAGKPKKWYYAVPIVLLWVMIICLIVKAFL